MKTFIFLISFSILFISVRAQSTHKITISGYVKEAVSNESLIGVNIYFPELNVGTVTNNYGFYSITHSFPDSATMKVSYVGYGSFTQTIKTGNNKIVDILLYPNTELNEIVVTGETSWKQSTSEKAGTISLPVSQIKEVPSLLGEKDVLKVVQLMPGVQKGSEGSSGIYVRGGNSDQNLILLDNATVYNASHLFGFFSIFNGDALKSVELIKGGFPARYGGRLSSVLDINMKDGNKEEWHKEGAIGIISSKLTVEGPIVKNKSSLLISGRRTYLDLLARPVMGKEAGKAGYYFYDLNMKINYDFGRKNKLYLSGYFGRDKLNDKSNDIYRSQEIGFFWGNTTGTVRWNHLFSDKIFSNTSLIYSNYKYSIYNKQNLSENGNESNQNYYSSIQDLSLKFDLDYMPITNHTIRTGFVGIFHGFKPYAYVETNSLQNIDSKEVKTIEGSEMNAYVEDLWNPLASVKINTGLRLNQLYSSHKSYFSFEPRIIGAWNFKKDWSVKISYATMNQFIHLLSNTGMGLPTDLWVPTTDRIKPEQSWQFSAGVDKDFEAHRISLSIEGYYKRMNNIIGYKEGASFILFDNPSAAKEMNWEDNVTSGKGWSRGIEILIHKREGKFNGWIGYTLSWTRVQYDSLNFGQWFFPKYDRRHDISIVGIYRLSDKVRLSCTWVYGTGNWITMPISKYKITEHVLDPGARQIIYGEDNYRNEFGNKNSFRMGAYHRLDLGIQFHKKKKWGERFWEISIYNVYNRKNPYFYFPVNGTNGEIMHYGYVAQFSLFPIIPSISYNFKF